MAVGFDVGKALGTVLDGVVGFYTAGQLDLKIRDLGATAGDAVDAEVDPAGRRQRLAEVRRAEQRQVEQRQAEQREAEPAGASGGWERDAYVVRAPGGAVLYVGYYDAAGQWQQLEV